MNRAEVMTDEWFGAVLLRAKADSLLDVIDLVLTHPRVRVLADVGEVLREAAAELRARADGLDPPEPQACTRAEWCIVYEAHEAWECAAPPDPQRGGQERDDS